MVAAHRDLGLYSRVSAAALRLPRGAKRWVMLACDVVGLPLALMFAFALASGDLSSGLSRHPLLYVGVVGASMPVFWHFGLYHSILRYIGPVAARSVFLGVTGSTACLLLMAETIAWRPLGVDVLIIYWLLAVFWVGGSRVMARWVLAPSRFVGEPVVIYGAGEAGLRLAGELLRRSGVTPIAYVDEKQSLIGTVIDDIQVISPANLPRWVARAGVTRVLLAIPSASRRRRAEVIVHLESLGLHVQTVPTLDDILTGKAGLADLREIQVADLLERDVVPPDGRLLDACIRSRVVMVTGAGGSIGSELCRQILAQAPERLILVDSSEPSLYQIDQELRDIAAGKGFDVPIEPLLCSVRDRSRMSAAMRVWGVQTVYHAAAHKHVPMVEQNVLEGLANNVLGTLNLARVAMSAGVDHFVLISTDKAVNPTSVMGASKRLAEIVLQGLQQQSTHTRFCMVRFGNVLGSSGSVVPLFERQIRAGGPVTVTHPEVRRYFMTIPEAVALVLQASAMASGGDVFVLDMGEPVRIADLARRMIGLMGLTVRDSANPEGDIEIKYTGLRPAEKLYEELLIGNNVTGTSHPMILRAVEDFADPAILDGCIARLERACAEGEVAVAMDALRQIIPEYRSVAASHDLIASRLVSISDNPRKVTRLTPHKSVRLRPR